MKKDLTITMKTSSGEVFQFIPGADLTREEALNIFEFMLKSVGGKFKEIPAVPLEDVKAEEEPLKVGETVFEVLEDMEAEELVVFKHVITERIQLTSGEYRYLVGDSYAYKKDEFKREEEANEAIKGWLKKFGSHT
jgi:hypothetical protein